MKQLLIIVYRLNVDGQTRDHVEQYFEDFKKYYSLREDEELKDNYIIREIFLPVINAQDTDIQIIYPIPNYVSPEINKIVDEITQRIKEDPTNKLKSQWERLVRELKIRNLKVE